MGVDIERGMREEGEEEEMREREIKDGERKSYWCGKLQPVKSHKIFLEDSFLHHRGEGKNPSIF